MKVIEKIIDTIVITIVVVVTLGSIIQQEQPMTASSLSDSNTLPIV
jgi:hypothetical protein